MNLKISSVTANVWTSRCKNDRCAMLVAKYIPPGGNGKEAWVHILFPGEQTPCIDPKPVREG